MSDSKKRVNKDMVLDMLETNRFLAMMLNRDGGEYNNIRVVKDGIEYTQQKPGVVVDVKRNKEGQPINEKGEVIKEPVPRLFVPFEMINDHLELEA